VVAADTDLPERSTVISWLCRRLIGYVLAANSPGG
jgi:hypothetical protein